MNTRAITTIMEQFIIFALGVVIFSMIAISFRYTGENIGYRNEIMGLSQATSYLAASTIEVWQISNAGENARAERAVSLPLKGTAEFRGREVCITTDSGMECGPVPLGIELKGKTYTLEKFTLISTEDGVEIK